MSQQQSTFGEAEKKAAERYLWWPIYLVREKRRLAGITEAVRAGAADAGHHAPLPTPPVIPGESAEEFLLRAEQQGEDAFPDPLAIFESQGEDLGAVLAVEPLPRPEISLAPPDKEVPSEPQEVDLSDPDLSALITKELASSDFIAPEDALRTAFLTEAQSDDPFGYPNVKLSVRSETNTKGEPVKAAYTQDGQFFGFIQTESAGDSVTLAYSTAQDGNLYGLAEPHQDDEE